MPWTELTGLARIALYLLNRADEIGIDPSEAAQAAGLTPADLRDPDARLPIPKIFNLWRVVAEWSDDEALGLHLAERLQARDLGLLGYTLLHSATLGDAMGRMVRFSHLVNETLDWSVEYVVEGTRMTVGSSPRLDQLRHPVDARLTACVTVSRELVADDLLAPRRVRFPYPPNETVGRLERFFRAPLEFECPRAELVWDPGDFNRPVVSADEALGAYLDEYAEQTLDSLKRDSGFVNRVRRALWKDLSGGTPTVRQTAAALGVSERTLQRRLREHGTTFATVLDELRRDMARGLLRDRNLAIYEVAYMLGYADPSTFYRAFRRWEGTAPKEYRQKAS